MTLQQATDADGESQGGGKVFYSLQEGNTQDEAFFMEPVSGELTIQRPLTHLDTPTSTYTLTVRATDAGSILFFPSSYHERLYVPYLCFIVM